MLSAINKLGVTVKIFVDTRSVAFSLLGDGTSRQATANFHPTVDFAK